MASPHSTDLQRVASHCGTNLQREWLPLVVLTCREWLPLVGRVVEFAVLVGAPRDAGVQQRDVNLIVSVIVLQDERICKRKQSHVLTHGSYFSVLTKFPDFSRIFFNVLVFQLKTLYMLANNTQFI